MVCRAPLEPTEELKASLRFPSWIGEEIPRTEQGHKGNERKRMDEMEIVEGLREEERRCEASYLLMA